MKQHVGWGQEARRCLFNVRTGARREEGGFRGGEKEVRSRKRTWDGRWLRVRAVAVRVGVVSVNGVGLAWVSPVGQAIQNLQELAGQPGTCDLRAYAGSGSGCGYRFCSLLEKGGVKECGRSCYKRNEVCLAGPCLFGHGVSTFLP